MKRLLLVMVAGMGMLVPLIPISVSATPSSVINETVLPKKMAVVVPASTDSVTYTCDKINGFKPCVSGYNAEGGQHPNIIQANFCSGEYEFGLGPSPSGTVARDMCVRWIRVGGQAVQGPLGSNNGEDNGSFFHEAALAHACSYAQPDPNNPNFYEWVGWPQSGAWHTLGQTPNGFGLGFCTSTYGSTFGQFLVRPTAGPGDLFDSQYEDKN